MACIWRAGDLIMQLSQFVPILFRDQRVEKPNRNGTEKGVALPLARCAPVIPRRGTPDATGFAPRCIPRTRAFSRWTRPKALRLLDFRPGGVSPSGHLTAVSTAASTRRAFVPSMDLQTGEDFALPPDPHRPGVCRHGPARGLCAHRPQRGFRAPAPRPTVRPVGCAPPHATAWGYCLTVFSDADRSVNLKRHAGAKQL
jgi:hypothetical protein